MSSPSQLDDGVALEAAAATARERRAAALARPAAASRRRSRRPPWGTLAAGAYLVVVAALAVFADPLTHGILRASAFDVDLAARFEPPSPAHWLGTDDFGRDQVARLLFGARVSLAVGGAAAALIVGIGVPVGLAAALAGRWLDDLVAWLVNTVRSVPQIFLLILVGSAFRVGPAGLAVVLGLVGWTGAARLVRGQALSLRERDYVLAARALGATPLRIAIVHLAPGLAPLVAVTAGIDMGAAILAESALSFLGLGIQPPLASWGNMLANAQGYFGRGPWLVYAPGAAIALTVWSLFTLGDGLRDWLDPRLADARR